MPLTDTLGITIAFITLILLMSVLVTALVQTAQGLLRLRARNLLKGLAALLVNIRHPDNEVPTTPEQVKKAKRDAMELLNTPVLAGSARVVPSTAGKNKIATPLSDLRYYLIGPRVSWIDKDLLPKALEQAKITLRDGDGDAVGEFKAGFERINPQLDKRFQMMARGWSFTFALVVAVVLQVSTPDLLRRLANDAEYRQRILANTDQDAAYAAGAINRQDYERASAAALQQLAKEFPGSRAHIEQASGIGPNKALIVDELAIALEGDDKANEILARYRKLLDSVAEQAATDAQDTLTRLSGYDIEIWQDAAFYYGPGQAAVQAVLDTQQTPDADPAAVRPPFDPARFKWGNIFGVLITTILLSLGAPFWYKALAELIGLRDRLAPKATSSAVDGQKKTGGAADSSK